MIERIIARIFLIQAFLTPPTMLSFTDDQFTLRHTGSTTAAAHKVTLQLHYKLIRHRLIASDFSTAFDTVRHSNLRHDIPDNI